jgi:UDP-glucose 4-epimerase
MFKSNIEMLPERNGNRLIADLVSEKTEALGWEAKHDIKDYINKMVAGY